MKVLLIGRSGQLGHSLMNCATDHDVVAPSRAELDILDVDSIRTCLKMHRPDLVINTAAFHNLAACQAQPEVAFRTNGYAVRALAQFCAEYGARLITFSTNYVFPGHQAIPYLEGDLPEPLQVYGASRLMGEALAMLAVPSSTTIVRTSAIFGHQTSNSRGPNFLLRQIQEAKLGRTLEISCDQTISVTYADDLARAIYRLAAQPNPLSGVVHLVNEGETTWYDFAVSALRIVGLPTEVVPVNRNGRDATFRRPIYSALANTRAREQGISLPAWDEALERFLSKEFG